MPSNSGFLNKRGCSGFLKKIMLKSLYLEQDLSLEQEAA